MGPRPHLHTHSLRLTLDADLPCDGDCDRDSQARPWCCQPKRRCAPLRTVHATHWRQGVRWLVNQVEKKTDKQTTEQCIDRSYGSHSGQLNMLSPIHSAQTLSAHDEHLVIQSPHSLNPQWSHFFIVKQELSHSVRSQHGVVVQHPEQVVAPQSSHVRKPSSGSSAQAGQNSSVEQQSSLIRQ